MIDIIKAEIADLRRDKFLLGIYTAFVAMLVFEVLGWNDPAGSWADVLGFAIFFPVVMLLAALVGRGTGTLLRRWQDGRKPKNQLNSPGIGLLGFVFLVFLVLKLTNIAPVADWSWWWVTAPLWGPTLLALVIMIPVGIVMLVKAVRA